MRGARRSQGVLAAAAVASLAVDVVSKVAAAAWLADGAIELGPLLTLRLVHNPGVAFGVGAALPASVVLGVTAAIAAVMGVMAWQGVLGSPLPAGLVAGAALGNVLDRGTGGSVVDFLDVGRWPTFNLADVFLVSGIALLLLRPGRPAPDDAPAPPLPDRVGH